MPQANTIHNPIVIINQRWILVKCSRVMLDTV